MILQCDTLEAIHMRSISHFYVSLARFNIDSFETDKQGQIFVQSSIA
jgi:hypothetical protein